MGFFSRKSKADESEQAFAAAAEAEAKYKAPRERLDLPAWTEALERAEVPSASLKFVAEGCSGLIEDTARSLDITVDVGVVFISERQVGYVYLADGRVDVQVNALTDIAQVRTSDNGSRFFIVFTGDTSFGGSPSADVRRNSWAIHSWNDPFWHAFGASGDHRHLLTAFHAALPNRRLT